MHRVTKETKWATPDARTEWAASSDGRHEYATPGAMDDRRRASSDSLDNHELESLLKLAPVSLYSYVYGSLDSTLSCRELVC